MKNNLLLLFLFLLSSCAFSQNVDSAKTVQIKLKDGTEIIGHIVAKDSVNLTVKGLSGVVSLIPRTEIVETKTLKGRIIGNEYYKPDPADNRLMAFPTARPLKRGEVQFNAVELIFPHLLIGVTDFLTVGLGGLPFVASGSGTFIYYLSSKITAINSRHASVAFGGAMVGATSSKSIVGVLYTVGTFGNFMRSLTVGPFFAFSNDVVFKRPAILLGGHTRISRSASLLSENVILFGNDTEDFIAFPSLGIRFSGEKLAADFGTYAVVSGNSFFYPIPWIGLTYKF